jgi:hypothetical protein
LFFAHGSAWLDPGLFYCASRASTLPHFRTTRFYECSLVRMPKLTAWKRLVKLSFLFIFALSIQGVWVFNIPE